MVKIPISSNGKIVGNFEDGVYTTKRKRTSYYRKGKGYSIDLDVMEQLRGLSCHTVIIDEFSVYEGARQHYFTFIQYQNAKTYEEHGLEQKCVPLSEAYNVVE